MHIVKGKHSVTEALQSGIKVEKIIVPYGSEKKSDIQSILRTAAHKRIPVQIVSPANFLKASPVFVPTPTPLPPERVQCPRPLSILNLCLSTVLSA